MIHLVPKSVIMVEGILIFENKALRDLMDIKIFVDTDADIRLCRRIKRDVNKRGRSMESVLLQYQATVKPMHDQYVEPSKKFADLVVLEGGKNLVALDMIMNRIQPKLLRELRTTIDDAWREHLREMDDLRQSVQNATYEQKDPLLIYKFEPSDCSRK